jgi:hypothetical protein
MTRTRALVVACGLALTVLGMTLPPAYASLGPPPGPIIDPPLPQQHATGTVALAPPPVRSILVRIEVSKGVYQSSNDFTYGTCSGPNATQLTLPSGTCDSATFTVTDGAAPSDIKISSTALVPAPPSDPNAPPYQGQWNVCLPRPLNDPSVCAGANDGTTALPGPDQASLEINEQAAQNSQGVITNIAFPHLFLDPTVSVLERHDPTGGDNYVESVWLQGPTTSSSSAPLWTHQLTWIALPLGA